ncbi:MAG: hypothetical protein K6G52_01870 [Treponemataceae bacterium]|nr:hypothetical protein [Treponemataceae bacterium]
MRFLKKCLSALAVFCLAINFYSQDFVFFEDTQQNDWEYVKTFKAFAQTNSYESGESLKEMADEFYATEEVSLLDCSMPVTQITLSALLYKDHNEAELGIDSYINEFKPYFLSISKKCLTYSDFPSKAAARLQALENAESLYPQKKLDSVMTESAMFSLLNAPRVFFVILNNAKYSSEKQLVLDAAGKVLSQKNDETSSLFAHENFIVFPVNIDDVYAKIPDEQKSSYNEILYKFSDGMTKVYQYAVDQKLYFSDFFLKEEMDVLQNILDDSFSVFALDEEQLSYFSSRFENILKYVAE